MKIYDVTKIYGTYEKPPVTGKTARKPQAAGKSDKLTLTRDAIDFQSVMKGLKEAPDVRNDKVAEHSAKYESGRHLADSRDIAEAIIKSGGIRNINNQ